MNLFKYNQFVSGSMVNENLQGAKKLLKDRFLMLKAVKELNLVTGKLKQEWDEGERKTFQLKDFTPEQQVEIKAKIRETKLTDEEARGIEKDPAFVKIRELVKDTLGWCYIFTYFYYVENVAFEELENIYKEVLEFRPLLNRLPKPLDNNFIDPNIPNNSEKLVDELGKLNRYRKLKKFLDELPGDMRREFASTSDLYKEKIEDLAVAFDDFGKNTETGKVDEKEKLTLQKFFFSKIKRYKVLREIIPQAENYIKGLDNKSTVVFYKKIEKCNEMFGIVGADIIFDEAGILILDIKSFQANKMLNSNTNHCIASYDSHWSSYVGTEQDNKFNRQYYIYNFNLSSADDLSVIGITIEPHQKVNACHTKSDRGYTNEFRGTLKRWEKQYGINEDLWSMFAPMSADDIAKKKRRIAANREIIKKNLSVAELQRLVREEGADVNRENGTPLLNAVQEGNEEKVKYLLQLGASPNLRQRAEAIINYAKSSDIVRLLVDHGAELTSQVFKNIMEDIGAVEYCLKAGMDPNFENSLPVRVCCKQGNIELLKLLVKYGATLKNTRSQPLSWAAENNRKDFIEYMLGHGADSSGFNKVKKWISHSTKFAKESDKRDMINYIDDLIKQGKVTE
jgi:hypothetical protein